MKRVRLTVTGAGSLFGQGILKSLRVSQNSVDVKIQGLDYFSNAFGFRYCDTCDVLPDILSKHVQLDYWYDCLVGSVKKFGSELLFVGADFELEYLAKKKNDFFEQTGCEIIISSSDTISLCKDKLNCARFLSANSLPAPITTDGDMSYEEAVEVLGQPFIVKPRRGSRSRGVKLVNSPNNFAAALNCCEEPLFQEYLSGDSGEFSCGILVLGGKLRSICVLKRILRDGNTWDAVSENPKNKEFNLVEAYCNELSKLIDFDGPANIQCRLVGEQPCCFEINPRFSGTTFFRTLLGVNEPMLCVLHQLGQDIPSNQRLKPGKVRRYYEECLED